MIGNFSEAIAFMTQQLNIVDLGIVDFDSPLVANSTQEASALNEVNPGDAQPVVQPESNLSAFDQYVNPFSTEYRFYLLENQTVQLRKFMKEIL